MEELYKWLLEHPWIAAAIGSLLTFLIGWALPNDKIKMAGFTVSQFIRRMFGAKLEEKIEQAIESFDEGMKADNKKDSK